MLNLENVKISPEERAKYRLAMPPDELAELPPAERLKYERAQLENVFGENPTFRNGKVVEVGIGGPLQQTVNHLCATERAEADRKFNEAILAAARKE